MGIFLGTNVIMSGDNVRQNECSVIISNHCGLCDGALIQGLLVKKLSMFFKNIYTLKFVEKIEIKNIPIIGKTLLFYKIC